MAYSTLKSDKEIRSCKTCRQKKDEMLYVRERKRHEWFYSCLEHAPFDREKYAMVEIDNRKFPDGKK
jgi:hypothetical protein